MLFGHRVVIFCMLQGGRRRHLLLKSQGRKGEDKGGGTVLVLPWNPKQKLGLEPGRCINKMLSNSAYSHWKGIAISLEGFMFFLEVIWDW